MGLELPKEALEASIIGTIGDMDGPMSADAKGWLSLRRYIMGTTDETRQRFRDEVSRTRQMPRRSNFRSRWRQCFCSQDPLQTRNEADALLPPRRGDFVEVSR